MARQPPEKNNKPYLVVQIRQSRINVLLGISLVRETKEKQDKKFSLASFHKKI